MESTQTLIKMGEPYKITLTKNTKGYGWEITVHAETLEKAISMIDTANNLMKADYGAVE